MNRPSDDIRVWEQLRRTPQLLVELTSTDAPCAEHELRVQKRLRARYPPELVRAAVELIQARQRARGKFSRADRMWFDRRGVEQATDELIARRKAERFAAHPEVVDLCCGVGGDTIALAQRTVVVAVDESPLACWFTRRNAEAYEVDRRVTVACADVRSLRDADLPIHIDPDGRPPRGSPAGGSAATRHRRLQELRPPLDDLRRLMDRYPGGAIKLSPASNFHGAFSGVEIELTSLWGECKEATVWFGSLRSEAPYRATVLPAGETLAGDPMAAGAPVGPPQRYLYDPDAAVVRAGLVDVLAERLRLNRLDRDDDYLTADHFVGSPMVTALRVLEVLPNNDRAIRQTLRVHRFRHVEIRHRRVRVAQPQRLTRGVTGGDRPPGVLVLARVAGRVSAIVAERVEPPQPVAQSP